MGQTMTRRGKTLLLQNEVGPILRRSRETWSSDGSCLLPTALPDPGTLGLSPEETGSDQGMMSSPQVSQSFLSLRTPFTTQVGPFATNTFAYQKCQGNFSQWGWRGEGRQ